VKTEEVPITDTRQFLANRVTRNNRGLASHMMLFMLTLFLFSMLSYELKVKVTAQMTVSVTS
jgi:hypothetical protein